MTRAIFPGTFDPLHNGHLDIVTRASHIFDEVILSVYDAPPKKLVFTTEERVEMAAQAVRHLPNVSVSSYYGLTIDCAHRLDAKVIVRGLRNVTDFTYEHQIGWANNELAPGIEYCCLFCRGEFALLSATILKEVASLGGDVRNWAPSHVIDALRVHYNLPDLPSSRGMTRTEGKFDRKE